MHKTTTLLGWLGLIPFLALSGWLMIRPETDSARTALQLYGFGIISFLAGSWWRNQRGDEPGSTVLLLSNGVFLLAFFAVVLLPGISLMLLSLALLLVLVLEQFTPLIGDYSPAYKRMRVWLSAVASSALAAAYLMSQGSL